MKVDSVKARYDVVVVGGGHNGLVAAAYLGRAGKSVLVLEKLSELGGATTSQRVFPDYDARLSRYSYLVSLLPSQILSDLGLRFETRRRTTASCTPYRDAAGAEKALILSNVDESLSRQSMEELTGSEDGWKGYQRLLELESALASVAWPTLLEPLRTRRDFETSLGSALEREAWKSFVEEPLGKAIERHIENDVLRGLVMTDGKIGVFTHPHDPSLIQNRCFAYHVIGGGTGEWRVPVGGMRALVDELVRVCQESGVDLCVDSPVARVAPGSPAEVHFVHQGQEHAVMADNVLLNTAPKTTARLLGEPWKPEASDEGSAVKINMLLRRLPKLKAGGVSPETAFAGSLHIDEGYNQMVRAWEEAGKGIIPNPAPGEIYCHTLTDGSILSPNLREKGFHTLTLFGLDMPYRLFEKDHDLRKQQVLDLYLAGLDRICEESFLDCLAQDKDGKPCIEIKTPQDLERDVDLDLGCIFHNTLSWFFVEDEADRGKWGGETQHPNIHIAGSAALRGGAVSGIPGHNAAKLVLDA